MRGFNLYKDGCVASIYLDAGAKDYPGLKRVGEALCEDASLVTGVKPQLATEPSSCKGHVIVAGTLGQNVLIDAWVKEGKLSVEGLSGKRECYMRTLVDSPMEGVDTALVIVGSEKLGTIYGMFSLSEAMGVSPWVYWGDVAPPRRDEVSFGKDEITFASKEPSVRYRGFFMNDEWPSLGNWVSNTFGDFDNHFYQKVFELLLRLKGNFFWPAMWSASFCLDGKEYPLANADLAEDYGIVMGTSHHEPLMRASEEWDKVKSTSNDEGYGKDWNYYANQRGLYQYWNDSVIRNKDYNSLVTIGMRGERDSTILGDQSGLQENVDLLKTTIRDQKEILRKNGLQDAPKVLALYKEVEDYYYGDEKVEGLAKWDELDDVMFLLSDDNFGNCRTLPTPENRDRKAGWGIYYHFDYHGGPVSYEWVNSTPLAKTWEQMTMAYDYGVRDLWIVNVGDLRPQELPLSFFLDMAYDFEAYGTAHPNETNDYTFDWSRKQFGGWASEDVIRGVAAILQDYTRMNGRRRPEVTHPETFSALHEREWLDELRNAQSIQDRAVKCADAIPDAMRAAYYGLVEFPAVASANVRKMNGYAALSQLYGKRGSGLANYYEALVKECIRLDETLTDAYNNKMADGKWKGMMSSAHIGFTRWNDEGWQYPSTAHVVLAEGARMMVDVEGWEEAFTDGEVALPEFTNHGLETHLVTISNGGKAPFDYEVATDSKWITLSRTVGTIQGQVDDGNVKVGTSSGEPSVDMTTDKAQENGLSSAIEASVDWDKAPAPSGTIHIKGNGQQVTLTLTTQSIDIRNLPPMTFMESRGVVSIEAEHYASNHAAAGVEWKNLAEYGRTLSAMKMYPTTVNFDDASQSPYMEYGIYLREGGEYEVTAYFAPSNNLRKEWGLDYALSFDGGGATVVDALPEGFVAGDHYNQQWCGNVLMNALVSTTKHDLAGGFHAMRFHGLKAGLALQKLVITKGGVKPSYYGAKESRHSSP